MNMADLREELLTAGSAQFTMPNGKRLFLVSSSQLVFVPIDQPSILVAMEGEGAFLWDISEPLNPFVLIDKGFGLTYAPTLVQVLRGLLDEPQREGRRPMLKGPQDR